MKMIVKSYAKVNLHLAVGSIRDDGFHSLQSIFAKISLHDIIEIDADISKDLNISIKGLDACNLNGEDTISKAIRLWCEKARINLDVKVNIKKRIPSEAGLGGGSSNGASTLLTLNKMFTNYRLSFDQLKTIALDIGSDVPFFLYDTTFAYVEGRGEFVEPLDKKFDYSIELYKPKHGVSTKGAFYKLDQIKRREFIKKEELINIFNQGVNQWKTFFYNDFELVIESDVLSKLREENNCFTLMSGSGSTCYKVCNKNDKCSLKSPFSEKYKHKIYTFSCFF
jgi:4-diphosphocytidyl-2-C-methyl-D-erythritol kinase